MKTCDNEVKLNVLCITRKYPPKVGGMENFSYNLLNGLDENQVNKKIIALGKSQINLIWFIPYCLLYILMTAKRWDVIYVGDAVLSVIGFIVKSLFPKTKTIVNVYGLDITYSNPIYQFYLKLFYNKFDRYICISRDTEQKFKARGGERSCIVTPGVNINKFTKTKRDRTEFNKKYNISKDNLVLITVGRLVKRKGVAWFIENVLVELKDKNFTYLIIGDGEEREKIKSLIKNYNFEGDVKLLGKVSDKDLEEIYINSDVFVMPNIVVEDDMEGFGIVAIEASLAGLIVVASGIEGINDAIINMKNGIILKSEDSKEYINKIEDIITDMGKYKILAKEFSEYTKREFSWNKICDKYIEIFKDVVSS